MEQHKIERINELSKKHKEGCLTSEEHEERKTLHKEYIDQFKKNLTNQLERISIFEQDGTKRKLKKKE
ncbi:MAG: DUF896 domain-containing protein [Oscillospiraceae bacterium]|nr:DUF896 domain-containing protein [Oscillospiraceae bacterium]